MTIIIALKDKENKRIILGADKQATYGQVINKVSSKLFHIPVNITDGYGTIIDTCKIHIAFSGCLPFASFLQYGFKIPSMENNQGFIEYYYKSFLPAFQKKVEELDLIEIRSGQTDTESPLILIFKGEVYLVDVTMGIFTLDNEFYIEGSGFEVATGSLYTNMKFHPEISKVDMVKQAILSAGESTVYCDSDVEVKVINYG